MSADKIIKIGRIIDGQYSISIDLNSLFKPEDIDKFKSGVKELTKSCDRDQTDIYRFEGDKFRYRSETIFPPEKRVKNRKILYIGRSGERIRVEPT